MRRYALCAFTFAFTGLAACDPPASVATSREPTVAAPSFAKAFNDEFFITDTVFNPCQPQEQVVFQGTIHMHGEVEETPTSIRGTFHSNTQGIEGVGLTSGDRYRGIENGQIDSVFSSPPPTLDKTFEIKLRLVRPGSADNLWSRSTFRFTYPPGTFQFVKSEIECRG